MVVVPFPYADRLAEKRRPAVVISTAAMLVWLMAAEVFRWVDPAARPGRKVAYLTLASFVFLVVTVISFVVMNTAHGGGPLPSASNQLTKAASS